MLISLHCLLTLFSPNMESLPQYLNSWCIDFQILTCIFTLIFHSWHFYFWNRRAGIIQILLSMFKIWTLGWNLNLKHFCNEVDSLTKQLISHIWHSTADSLICYLPVCLQPHGAFIQIQTLHSCPSCQKLLNSYLCDLVKYFLWQRACFIYVLLFFDFILLLPEMTIDWI